MKPRLFIATALWLLMSPGLSLHSAGRAANLQDPALVIQAYMRATFARDFTEAYRFISSEDRRDHLLAGGEKDGYAVRVTGTFVTSKDWLDSRKTGGVMLFGGRVHSATRALLRDIGVEIVEW